jgi:hypothetical protein
MPMEIPGNRQGLILAEKFPADLLLPENEAGVSQAFLADSDMYGTIIVRVAHRSPLLFLYDRSKKNFRLFYHSCRIMQPQAKTCLLAGSSGIQALGFFF